VVVLACAVLVVFLAEMVLSGAALGLVVLVAMLVALAFLRF
jgi:hypothetical protein